MNTDGGVAAGALTAPAAENRIFNATLVERHDLTRDLAVVVVRPDEGGVPEFRAGQYVLLGLPPDDGPAVTPKGRPRLVRRAYSIASPEQERRHFELYVVLVENGRLSQRLWTVAEGGRLWLDPAPRGGFTLDHADRDHDLLMVATGTGVAPYLSMLRTCQVEPPWRRCVLVHGVRRVADLGHRAELEARAAADPRFSYLPIVSREPWSGPRGRVQAILDDRLLRSMGGVHLDPAQLTVLLCGNPAMISETTARLVERGFDPDRSDGPGAIRFERYW